MSQAFRTIKNGHGRVTPFATTHNASVGRADLLVIIIDTNKTRLDFRIVEISETNANVSDQAGNLGADDCHSFNQPAYFSGV